MVSGQALAEDAASQINGEPPRGIFRTAVRVMAHPKDALTSGLEHRPLRTLLLVPGIAFALFFLQTGLDLHRAGAISSGDVVLEVVLGLLFGFLVVPALALVAWAGVRVFGGEQGTSVVVRAFALAYGGTLVYAAVGLAVNLTLHWNTALSFGATGLLWALGPIFAIIRETVHNRIGPAVVISTVCGVLMLIGWTVLGGVR